MISRAELQIKSVSELVALAGVCLDLAQSKAVEQSDPSECVRAVYATGFDGTTPRDPFLVGDYLALTGYVRALGKTRHRCQLCTVRSPALTDMWAWDDDAPSLVTSELSRMDDDKLSVSLHMPVEGMVVVRHTMTWDGTRHHRTSATAWRYTDGLLAADPSLLVGALPPPHVLHDN